MVTILLLSATVFVSHSALAEESTGMANESLNASTNETELVSFVESAVAYAKENGKDMALKEFSNKTGSFVVGDLYIYAYDFNGTCLAHPFNPDWIGKNKLDITDSNGILSLRNTINVAKEGEGFTYFIFPNPVHDNKNELKIGYAMKVDETWFLGSGLYLSNISASFDQEERNELVAFANEALKFAKENGKKKSLEVFNDPESNFAREGRYIFAYDYDGRTLALPYQPELIGTNRFNVQDLGASSTSKHEYGQNGERLYYIYLDHLET
jgi:polar amino acid transport system substrate-binding protein